MENELLTFEVSFLKARLAESERFEKELKTQAEKAEISKASVEKRLREAEAKRQRTENDITLLMRRLSSSPLGQLFRRRESFRELESRYL